MLSVIIPAKNEEDYLPLLLDSIRYQTYKDLEIIVADAKSTDHTARIAKRYGCNVVEGGYPDEGRNSGAKVASSDLYLFLDADLILPSSRYLENAIRDFNKRGLDVASGLITPIKTGNYFMDLIYKAFYWFNNFGIKIESTGENPLMANVMFAKKKVHDKIGGFKAFEFGEDSKYARDAVKNNFKFGIVNPRDRVHLSPRRLIQKGFFPMLYTYLYFNFGQIISKKEFTRENSPRKYFD